MNLLRSLWYCRYFIYGSVKREFQLKYLNSLLGSAWTIINPLAMIVVYTVIFASVMRAKLPGVDSTFAYSIYLCSGLLTWSLFAEIVGQGQQIFLANANLLKKISFPRISLPVILVLNALVNFVNIFGLFLIFLMVSGLWPGWTVVAAIPVLGIQLLFAIGLGFTLGILNVFFRDVGQFFSIFLQFWFWLTPIVYPASLLPAAFKHLMVINPMFPLVQAYQGIFVSNQWPNWSTLVYPVVLGLLLCAFGMYLFRQHVGEIVDEL